MEELQSSHNFTITPLSDQVSKTCVDLLTLRNLLPLVTASLWLRMIEFDLFPAPIDE